jgi:ribonuclease BN (tRNA processing enzyme)
LAAQAGVGRLVLTHIWAELDPEQSRREAADLFANVMVAEEMQSYAIG